LVCRFGRQIPDAQVDAKGRELRPHVTIRYGLTSDDPILLSKILSRFAPPRISLGRTFMFDRADEKGYDVLNVEVESPDLEAISSAIRHEYPGEDTQTAYIPHVCIAYMKPGEAASWTGRTDLEGESFVAPVVVMLDRQGIETALPLRKPIRPIPLVLLHGDHDQKSHGGEGGGSRQSSGNLADGRAEEDRDIKDDEVLPEERRTQVLARTLGARTGGYRGVAIHLGASPPFVNLIAGGSFAVKPAPEYEPYIRTAIDRMVAAGLPLPKMVGAGCRLAANDIVGSTTAGIYVKESDMVILDPNDGKRYAEMVAKNQKEKWWSSDTVLHELSHAAHTKAGGATADKLWDQATARAMGLKGEPVTLDEKDRLVARKVSRYAEADKLEFVAETLSGILSGKTYPKDVMGLYAKFGGPKAQTRKKAA
jgi:hypothetical protein